MQCPAAQPPADKHQSASQVPAPPEETTLEEATPTRPSLAPAQPLGTTLAEASLAGTPQAPAKSFGTTLLETMPTAREAANGSSEPCGACTATLALQTPDDSRTAGCASQRDGTAAGDVDDALKPIFSFKGCEELLRGSSLSVLIRNQARIFSDSTGSAAHYVLSKPTKLIDVFLSHNWCVPPWQKWLCLCMHFNLLTALALTLVTQAPLGVLAVYGCLPTVQLEFARYPRSYVFRLSMCPIYIVYFCFHRDILRCVQRWNPVVFLDKTCINQEDEASRRKGIEKLNAFLHHSRTMVVCYTDMYLMRLWTVYEMVAFMTMHSARQIKVVPVMFPIVFMLSMGSLYFGGAIGLLFEVYLGFYYSAHVVLFVLCYSIMVVLRGWSRRTRDMYSKVSRFSVRDTMCRNEEDRPLVYANIAALMKATQKIGKEASEEAALDCFDQFVRKYLADALILSVGKYSIRYEHAAFIGSAFISTVLDQSAGLAHGMLLREFCNYALWYACQAFVSTPITFIGFFTWSDRCLHIKGWREHAYLAVGLTAVAVFIAFTRLPLDLLESWANESNLGMLVFVLLFLIPAGLLRTHINSSPYTKTVEHNVDPRGPRMLELSLLPDGECDKNTDTLPGITLGRAVFGPA